LILHKNVTLKGEGGGAKYSLVSHRVIVDKPFFLKMNIWRNPEKKIPFIFEKRFLQKILKKKFSFNISCLLKTHKEDIGWKKKRGYFKH